MENLTKYNLNYFFKEKTIYGMFLKWKFSIKKKHFASIKREITTAYITQNMLIYLGSFSNCLLKIHLLGKGTSIELIDWYWQRLTQSKRKTTGNQIIQWYGSRIWNNADTDPPKWCGSGTSVSHPKGYDSDPIAIYIIDSYLSQNVPSIIATVGSNQNKNQIHTGI